MKTETTPTPAKPKRVSKVRRLEDLLAAELKRIETLEAEREQQRQVLAAKERQERTQAEEIDALRERLRLATEALRPFFERTKDWEGQWPPDKIAVTRRLTFGDLRHARETFISLNK